MNDIILHHYPQSPVTEKVWVVLGIKDLARPEFGRPVTMAEDQVPVFWACGVTPQAVVATVTPPFCITHKPGHMLVTDRCTAEFSAAAAA